MRLSENFKKDLDLPNTHLIPVVVFEGKSFNDVWDSIYISTQRMTLTSVGMGDWQGYDVGEWQDKIYQPLLLNVPTWRESVNRKSKKFKVSSLDIEVSNEEYNFFDKNQYGDSREPILFSDLISRRAMINEIVTIFWKSPSTKYIIPTLIDDYAGNIEWGAGTHGPADCPIAYSGRIKKIKQKEHSIVFTLEDSGKYHYHREPVLKHSVETEDGIENIPMVYGRVEHSPGVLEKDTNIIHFDSS